MEEDNNVSAMVICMLVATQTVSLMAMENTVGLLAIFIKVIFSKVLAMDKATWSLKELSMMAYSIRTLNMGKECKNIPMDSNSKANFYKDNDIKEF
jgi:hypothetical protein